MRVRNCPMKRTMYLGTIRHRIDQPRPRREGTPKSNLRGESRVLSQHQRLLHLDLNPLNQPRDQFLHTGHTAVVSFTRRTLDRDTVSIIL